MVAESVKSVRRVFRVLECFEKERQPLSATAIARALDYPQSSTQALLKTIVASGYLTYDRQIRAYFPTPRILLTTQWLADTSTTLLEAMQELRERTGETVTLSCYRNADMQIVQVIQGSHPISLAMHPGDRYSLFQSAIGLAFLADQSDRLLDRLIRRGKKVVANDAGRRPVDEAAVRDAVAETRRRGVAIGYGLVIADAGAIAAPIRCPASGASYVLSVGGPIDRISENEETILDELRQVIDAHGHASQGFLESTVRPGLERITSRFEAHFETALQDEGIGSRESQALGLLFSRGALDLDAILEQSLAPGPAVREALESLVAKELVSLSGGHYHLTSAGRAMAGRLTRELGQLRSELLGPIDEADAENLQRMLDRLSGWLRSAVLEYDHAGPSQDG